MTSGFGLNTKIILKRGSREMDIVLNICVADPLGGVLYPEGTFRDGVI